MKFSAKICSKTSIMMWVVVLINLFVAPPFLFAQSESVTNLKDEPQSTIAPPSNDGEDEQPTATPVVNRKVIKGEGYKGIPWGTSYNDSGLATKNITNDDEGGHAGFWPESANIGNIGSVQIWYAFAEIFGVPFGYSFLSQGRLIPGDEFVPNYFSLYSSGDRDADVYIFYNDQFAMVFSPLAGNKDYSAYLSKVEGKYQKIKTIPSKNYETPPNASGQTDFYQIRVDLFQGKGTEMDLIKFDAKLSDWGNESGIYMLKGSTFIMAGIRKDIKALIKESKNKENSEEKKKEKEDTEKLN